MKNESALFRFFSFFIAVVLSLVGAYAGLLALLSIWIGISELSQPGAWVPITLGGLILAALFLFFIHAFGWMRRVFGKTANLNLRGSTFFPEGN